MTEDGSTKIVNFMTSGVGVFVLRCGHIRYMMKIQKSSPLLPATDQTNRGYSDDVRERVHQNYKFHDPQDSHSCARASPNKS